jgi:DNA-binding transcriptional LysR family regulator
MELRELRSLVAVAETGSILLAAERCHLSPAAVHKHLKALETELGVKIYSKGKGRLVLTQAGEIVLPHAREMLAQHESALGAIGDWRIGRRGLVRIGAGPSFSSQILPGLIRKFRRLHRSVDVYVETGASAQLVDRLKNGALDAIFDAGSAALEDRGLERAASWRSTAGFVAAKGMAPANCRLRTLEKSPFILFQKGTRMEPIVQAYFDALNFRPRVVMRSDSAEAIKAMIRAGMGLSVLFRWNIANERGAGAFTWVRTEAPPLQSAMTLIKVKTNFTPRAVEAFLEIAARTEWKALPLFSDPAIHRS